MSEVLKKQCNACLEELSLDNFYGDSLRPLGKSDKCIQCTKEKRKAIRGLVVPEIGESKVCEICNIEKDLSKFKARKNRPYSHDRNCKQCMKEGKGIKDKVFDKDGLMLCKTCNTFHPVEYYKQQSLICKFCKNSQRREYNRNVPVEIKREAKRKEYEKHSSDYKRRAKRYKELNREKLKEQARVRNKRKEKEAPLYKLQRQLAPLIKTAFNKGAGSQSLKLEQVLGCKYESFKQHLEKQFINWMNWDNRGYCETNEYDCSWHLDHIIPVNYAKTEEEVYLINHWSNFQPLCGKYNTTDKRSNFYPLTNLELKITFYEDRYIKY